MNKLQLINLINNLKIDKSDFWVLSSSALVLRDLFENAGDLDIAVTKKGLNKLKENYDLIKKDNGWYQVTDDIECHLDEYNDYKVELTDICNLESLQKYFDYLITSKREKDVIKYNIVKDELIKRKLINVHFMKLQSDPFNSIKSGTKTIEMRLNDEKRSLLKPKDLIIFEDMTSHEKIECYGKKLYKFDSFEDLYNHFDKVSIGYKENEKADPHDMSQYYDEDKINKYKVLAIEIIKR